MTAASVAVPGRRRKPLGTGGRHLIPFIEARPASLLVFLVAHWAAPCLAAAASGCLPAAVSAAALWHDQAACAAAASAAAASEA
eukprot:CAMPEP_0204152784 /NCGR_PEP_ID=MMETSP0361-20130328/27314_1 /ASSEMBLY_ACC=CAM_ASM_000343 /TAXON_ID=268821 /ORGANISM="Scrippsiella Hangoei, Strain SHTV-5" /LENGTH=83 /DNA_ID=CAMNT_0051107805 /DNA_START=1 /DNA_END=249 /DNA_ORIENTATION=+